MPHVNVPPGIPGIVSLFAAFPRTAKPLQELAQELLRGASPLTTAEREMIAAFVSSRNQCSFCTGSHAAAAKELLGRDAQKMDDAIANPNSPSLSPKMQALLAIADKVRADARTVSAADVRKARDAGADDATIHDAVLIAAAFCMFNRYVDGLDTVRPPSPDAYIPMGKMLAQQGYVRPAGG